MSTIRMQLTHVMVGVLATCSLLVTSTTPANAAVSPVSTKISVDGTVSRLIVKYAKGVAALTTAGGAVGAERVTSAKILPGDDLGSGMRTVRLATPVTADEALRISEELTADPRILWAEPDRVLFHEPQQRGGAIGRFNDISREKSAGSTTASPVKSGTEGQKQSTKRDVSAQTACTAATSVEPISRCFDDDNFDAGESVDAEIIWSDAYVKASSPTVLYVDIVPYATITDDDWLTLSDTWLEVDFDLDGDGETDLAITPEGDSLTDNQSTPGNVSRYVDGDWVDADSNCSASVTRKLADHAAVSGTSNSWWQISANWSCLFAGQTSNVRVGTYLEDYWAYDLSPDSYGGTPMNFSSLIVGAPTITTLSPSSGPTSGGTTVTISGTNLGTTSDVMFGTNSATIVSLTSTSVRVTTPMGVAGATDVTVVNAVASATKFDGFVYQSSAVGTRANVSFTNPDGTTVLPQAFTYTAPVPPTITAVSPSAGPTAGNTTLVVTGTGMANVSQATVCGFDADITARTATTTTISSPSNIPGSCAISLTNVAGTTTSGNLFRYVAEPVMSSVSASTGSTAGGQSISIVGENLADVTVIRFGTTTGTIVSKSATSLVATTPARAAGLVDISLTSAGGTATMSGAFTFSAPATIASASPASGSTLGGTRVTVTGTNLANASAVTFGGTSAEIVSRTATSLVVTTPARVAGAAEIAVTTPAGRVARASAYTFIAPARATIRSVSPATGFTVGGTRVTLTGTAMSEVSSVRFGGVSAEIVSRTSTSVVVNTPALAAGAVAVEVTNPGGVTTLARAFTYTVAPRPTVTAISPNSGSSLGGTRVTMKGTALANVSEVLFGSTAATIVSKTATSLVVTTPAVSAGTVNISVTNVGETLVKTAAFTFKDVPTLISASPVNGPLSAGTIVTLTGTNLGSASSVTFGGTAGTITSRSATSVEVTAPARAAGAVAIVVTTPGGTATLANGYTYVASPTITSISPSTGALAGGTKVTITGTNLALTSSVTLAGTPMTLTARTATTLRFVTPAGASAGAKEIVVTTPGGQVIRSTGFTYNAIQRALLPGTGTSLIFAEGVTRSASDTRTKSSAKAPKKPKSGANLFARSSSKPSAPQGVVETQSLTRDVTIQTVCTAAASVEPYHRCWNDDDYDAGDYAVDSEIIWSDAYVKAATPTVITVDLIPYATITDSAFLTYDDAWLEFDFDLDQDGYDDVSITPNWVSLGANQSTSAYVSSWDSDTGEWVDRGYVCSGTIVRKAGDHAAITGTANSWWQLNINWACLFQGHSSEVAFSTYIEDYEGYDYAPDYYDDLPVANIGSILAPTLTSLAPTSGPTAGNTSVTLTGTKMSAVTDVDFDGEPATIVSRTATTVVVRTPPHDAGVVDVTVWNDAGSATRANAFTYLSMAPRVTSLSVNSGSSEGGTTVIATGANLGNVSEVTVGGQVATITARTATTVTFVTPVAPVAAELPTDTKFVDGTLWGLNGTYGIDAPTAWAQTLGSPDVVVAVIDTGGTVHSDAGGTVSGYDMVSLDDTDGDGYGDTPYSANDGDGRDSNPSDPGDWISSSEADGISADGFFSGCYPDDSSWHGTHVAGTINAASNALGVVGVAPGVKVQHVRALGKCGGYLSDIIAAIEWASGGSVSGVPTNATPADVINMSLGGPGSCSTAMQSAINNAVARGTTVVVAAGNENTDAAGSNPANCSNVIVVGATGSNGLRANFSNYGSRVDVAAPGVGILSTVNTGRTNPVSGGYASYSGTSMATPHVAGIVALMISMQSSLTPAEIESALKSTAGPFGGARCDSSSSAYSCGTGIANAGTAVQ